MSQVSPKSVSTRPPSRIKVGLIQSTATEAKAPNVEKTVARIAQAAKSGADLVCLQELFAGHYFCQSEDYRRFSEAEPLPGPTSEAIAAAARDNNVVVVGSFFEQRAPGIYHNTAVVYERDGSPVGVYRKMHIPDDPLYYEKFYFTPGDLGFHAFDTSVGRIATLICWDQWYPEAARLMAMDGAQILFYPTAIGWHLAEKAELGASQHSAWETMMRSHAIANGMFVAAVNRTGLEGGLDFWGGSFVADPSGNLLAKAPHDEEALLIVECNLDQIDFTRTHWPFFRDRRIDAYGDLTQRFRR